MATAKKPAAKKAAPARKAAKKASGSSVAGKAAGRTVAKKSAPSAAARTRTRSMIRLIPATLRSPAAIDCRRSSDMRAVCAGGRSRLTVAPASVQRALAHWPAACAPAHAEDLVPETGHPRRAVRRHQPECGRCVHRGAVPAPVRTDGRRCQPRRDARHAIASPERAPTELRVRISPSSEADEPWARESFPIIAAR